jgi:PEP-CTERM motif
MNMSVDGLRDSCGRGFCAPAFATVDIVWMQRGDELMNLKFSGAIAAALIVIEAAGNPPARAGTALVDFENTPSLAAGPNIYVAVPGPQIITTTPATFSGGVVLGFATFFPAISFATPPNVYGTADFGNGLPEKLTITIDPAFATTEVSFALFNGEVFNQSYTVDAFNGASLVANQTLTNIAPNFNSGYGLVDLVDAGGITSVTIAPVGAPSAWDFLIDTVAFNQSITSIPTPPPLPIVQPAVPPVQGHRHGHSHGEVELLEVNFGDDVNDIRGSVVPVVPEPASCSLMLVGLGLLGFISIRRKLQAA